MSPETSEDNRRSPAKFKSIEDVSGEETRVAIIGTIVDKGDSEVVIDDGTGKTEVNFDLSRDLSDFKDGNKVRVIGRPQGNGIDGEAIQDFSGFDLDLYEKIMDKINEIK